MPKVVTDHTNNPISCSQCNQRWSRMKYMVDRKIRAFCYECLMKVAPETKEAIKKEMKLNGEYPE